MPVYCVDLHTDAAWARTEIEAENIDAAFAKAFAIDSAILDFQPFTEPLPVNEITIADPTGEEWVWRDEALLVRLAAEDLLIAAKNLLTALKDELLANGADRATLTALRHLKQAIDTAEGRRS